MTMKENIFSNITDFLKDASPISIAANIGAGIILLLIGVIVLSKKKELKKWGWGSIVVSGLFFTSAISSWVFANIVF